MVGPINLDVLDPPDLEQTKFGPDMNRWLSNIVDIINASFTTLNNAFSTLIAVGQTNAGGSGTTATVTVSQLITGNYVSVTLISSSNPTAVISAVAGSGNFVVTFSANPGVSAIIAYQAFTGQPQ